MNIRSFSNEGQDILAAKLVPHPGFFLDIGSGNPVYGNNSFALELMGWKGLLVDGMEESIERARRYRTNPAVLCDVTKVDWLALLAEVEAPSIIDFISMDTDAANTVLVQRFPFDKYQFKLMTFEHDRYQGDDSRKRACGEALVPYPQYIKLLDNAKVQGLEWEDWYVNTRYISSDILAKRTASMDWQAFLNTL